MRSNLDLSALNLDQLNLGSLNSQQNGTGSAYWAALDGDAAPFVQMGPLSSLWDVHVGRKVTIT